MVMWPMARLFRDDTRSATPCLGRLRHAHVNNARVCSARALAAPRLVLTTLTI